MTRQTLSTEPRSDMVGGVGSDREGILPLALSVEAREQRLRHALRHAGYFAGKKLTVDWTSHNFAHWARILEGRREYPMRILEIGSYEGRSALFFLNYLPTSRIVCVDVFGGKGGRRGQAKWAQVEERFDQNLAPLASRYEKRKGFSADVLPVLALEGYRFELIYVDGDHHAANVYSDAALAWPLLAAGGIMIFDDYEWDGGCTPQDQPRLGIDSFLGAIVGQYRELHRRYQIIVEKI